MIFSLLLMVIIEEYIKNQTKIKVKTFKIRYKMHLNILEVMNKLIIRILFLYINYYFNMFYNVEIIFLMNFFLNLFNFFLYFNIVIY
jgi:hypothetical protein